MTSMGLVDGLEQNQQGRFVRIQWEEGTGRGAELPRAYFNAVVLANAPEIVESAELVDDRQIAVYFTEFREGTHDFSLRFPDRQDHIDCSHGGMQDRYFLDVSIEIDSGGDLVRADFEQRVELGDY